jgi:hypothetical protein
MKISVVLPVLDLSDPFMFELTRFVIKALRLNTQLEYELVVVETLSARLRRWSHSHSELAFDEQAGRIDQYIHCPEKTNGVKDTNLGINAASGDIIIVTANDIIVTAGWLEAIVECFERCADCGLASLSASEPGHLVGPAKRLPLIVEGSYTPIMAFRKGWALDEAYAGGYSDSDLIMRIYAAGMRAYRHCGVQVHHLNHLTIKTRGMAGHQEIADGEKLFYERWGGSPLMMFQVIKFGGSIYGREHEALLHRTVPYMERVKRGEV